MESTPFYDSPFLVSGTAGAEEVSPSLILPSKKRSQESTIFPEDNETKTASALLKMQDENINWLTRDAVWNCSSSPSAEPVSPFPKIMDGFFRVELCMENDHSAGPLSKSRIIFKNSSFWKDIDDFDAQQSFSLRCTHRRDIPGKSSNLCISLF